MRERRRMRRRICGASVMALCATGTVEIDATDISPDGMRIQGAPADVATLRAAIGPVLLQLQLPGDDDPHFCFGETRRHTVGAGVGIAGIEFVLLSQGTRSRLERLSGACA